MKYSEKKFRLFVQICLLLILFVACKQKKNDSIKVEKKPNILFVFADQLRSDGLSCYGGENVQTPNFDRLAKEGVRMTNTISTYPICSPFRGMMLTGLYPLHNGMTNNDHHLHSDITSFAEVCADAGYKTAFIGKWHLDGHGRTSYIPSERRQGFQHWEAIECTHDYFNSPYYEGDSDSLKVWEEYDALSQTKAVQRYIKKRKKEDPFFLMLAWGPPHVPCIAPKKYMDKYKASEMKLRPNVSERAIADELLKNPRFNSPNRWDSFKKERLELMEDPTFIPKEYAGYAAATNAIDDYFGEILKTLKEVGELDNTIIVFTSDHGDNMGSHHMIDKNTPFHESLSIPFLIRYPKKIAPNTISDALMAPIDMMPTVVSLAGIQVPEVDGKDLSDVITGTSKDTQDELLIMNLTHLNLTSINAGIDTWRGVKTKKYTYARYQDGKPWVLFDDEKDPYQLNNLVSEPSYAAVMNELNTKTDILLKEAGDPNDTKLIYDLILKENPERELIYDFRKANPGHPQF